MSHEGETRVRDVLGYVCENCGRFGPMSAFQDECRPGWTHGRLIRVFEVVPVQRGAEDTEAVRLLRKCARFSLYGGSLAREVTAFLARLDTTKGDRDDPR